jgi:hypothetical protein
VPPWDPAFYTWAFGGPSSKPQHIDNPFNGQRNKSSEGYRMSNPNEY